MDSTIIFAEFISSLIKRKFVNIKSMLRFQEYINNKNLSDLKTITKENKRKSIDFVLYFILLSFYKVNLNDKEIESLSKKICRLFPEFTIADIYFVFANEKKYYLNLFTVDQVLKKVLRLFERHRAEKIIFMYIIE